MVHDPIVLGTDPIFEGHGESRYIETLVLVGQGFTSRPRDKMVIEAVGLPVPLVSALRRRCQELFREDALKVKEEDFVGTGGCVLL